MCGRYRIDPEDNPALQAIIDEINRKEAGKDTPRSIKTGGEVFPGDLVPVICHGKSGETGAFAMEWGYSLPDGKRLINARMETAARKPLFRDGMEQRRCLLPMSAYHEWESRGLQKLKYRIRPQAEGLHCLAGIYRYEGGRPVCAVLTMEAADEIAFIHSRMPVIFSQEDGERWLDGGRSVPAAKMVFAAEEGVPVQTRMDFGDWLRG